MIKLLITVPCKAQMMERLTQEFSDVYDITFAQADEEIIARELPAAEVIIGEPHPSQLANAQLIHSLRKWAGDFFDERLDLERLGSVASR